MYVYPKRDVKRGEEAFFYYGKDRDVIDNMLPLEDNKETNKNAGEKEKEEGEKGDGTEIEIAKKAGQTRTTRRRGRK